MPERSRRPAGPMRMRTAIGCAWAFPVATSLRSRPHVMGWDGANPAQAGCALPLGNPHPDLPPGYRERGKSSAGHVGGALEQIGLLLGRKIAAGEGDAVAVEHQRQAI